MVSNNVVLLMKSAGKARKFYTQLQFAMTCPATPSVSNGRRHPCRRTHLRLPFHRELSCAFYDAFFQHQNAACKGGVVFMKYVCAFKTYLVFMRR